MKEASKYLLAYDTSREVLSVALFRGPEEVAVLETSDFTRHSEKLAPTIDRLLKENRVKPADLQVIAAGVGPGSFTGLRVGVTTAKILSYTLGIKLIGVSSFEAVARVSRDRSQEAPVVVWADAKRGKRYAAVYAWKRGKLVTKRPPFLISKEELLAEMPPETLYLDEAPRARQIAEIALEKLKIGHVDDPLRLEPQYLYPRDCNVTLPRKK